MKIRKHLRTQTSTIDYIIADFSFSKIIDKKAYMAFCVDERLHLLHKQYDSKLDKILTFIIKHCSYDNLPIESLSRIILSLTKVTNVLLKGFTAIIS